MESEEYKILLRKIGNLEEQLDYERKRRFDNEMSDLKRRTKITLPPTQWPPTVL